ncbi:MAG: TPM domain-containing protein, partial [Methylotenera sp.]
LVPTPPHVEIAIFCIRVVYCCNVALQQLIVGVLLLVAKNDRKMRIEVGYGLEGAIPDVIAKRIIAEIMAPHFRQGDFYGGILQATEQVMRLIKGEQLPPPSKAQSAGKTQLLDMLPALLIAALVAGGIMRAIFGKFLGGLVNGGVVGLLIWVLGGGLLLVLLLAVITFVLTFAGASNLAYVGGMGGGGYGRSGGWGGGGGGFGGGGASGSW